MIGVFMPASAGAFLQMGESVCARSSFFFSSVIKPERVSRMT